MVLTGPRESGKTTLSRACFPDHEHVNLERLDVREFAETDPKGFLAQHAGPVILDEAQLVPSLFSYLQAKVDDDPTPGRFVLVGSHFGLIKTIGQSLAGRAATLNLLPLSLEETRRFPPETGSSSAEGGRASTDDLWTTVWTGGYPRIHDQQLPAAEWLADYAEAYVQRDVRQAFRATHLPRFVSFMRLAAGRAARELNLSSLGSDVGVAHPTIRVWLSLLEAGFLVFRAPPWRPRLRKRFVKTPKLYFVDSGLACHLLGIRDPDQLRVHPLRGALFESWCASEIIKARAHRGEANRLFHLREVRGLKLDLLVETARHIIAVETMSGATVMFGFPRPLDPFPEHAQHVNPHLSLATRIVHGGNDRLHSRGATEVVPWSAIQDVQWV